MNHAIKTEFGTTGQFLGEAVQPGMRPNPHASEAGWWFRPVGSGTNSTGDMPGFGERRSNMNSFITGASIINHAAKDPLHKYQSRERRANETFEETRARQKAKYEQRRIAAGEKKYGHDEKRHSDEGSDYLMEYRRYRKKRELERLAAGKPTINDVWADNLHYKAGGRDYTPRVKMDHAFVNARHRQYRARGITDYQKYLSNIELTEDEIKENRRLLKAERRKFKTLKLKKNIY